MKELSKIGTKILRNKTTIGKIKLMKESSKIGTKNTKKQNKTDYILIFFLRTWSFYIHLVFSSLFFSSLSYFRQNLVMMLLSNYLY